jgi:HK97 family phage portal protein
MGLWQRLTGTEERAGGYSLENPAMSLASNSDELLKLLGGITGNGELPHVSIESGMKVPAVFMSVGFLSRCLASLPLHVYRKAEGGDAKRLDGDLQMLLNEAPNPEWTSDGWRRYMFQCVFTGGRGLTWIERRGSRVVALWPMDPDMTSIGRRNGRKYYRHGSNEYPAADVIDVPFMLKSNQLDSYSPILDNRETIGLALAMSNYAAQFFSSGGVPPLALEGPLPAGPEAFKRAMSDIKRAIDTAKKAALPFFGMPPGHSLKPIGIDPDKGQMTEARLFQLQEIGCRIYGLPPAFVGDLSKGTFSNTEQQDLQLAKHPITHWSKAFEDEVNLKLFGQRNRSRYAEHNLDGLQRGDWLTRINGIARAIQTSQMTPDEARGLENRPPDPTGAGAKLYMQGATVPLGTQAIMKPDNGEGGDAGDETKL